MKKEDKLRIWRESEITYLDGKGTVHKEPLKKFFSLRPYYFCLKLNKLCYTFIAYTPTFEGEGNEVRPRNFAYGVASKLAKKTLWPVIKYGLKHDFDKSIK